MNAATVVGRQSYLGVFTLTLATLMYEVLLTRIFSVTMWYHFAFVAISVAMFGMTAGAVLVYLFPNYFSQERTKQQLTLGALLFALSIVVSFLTHLSIPFVLDRSIVSLFSIAFTYLVLSIPFIFSGVCVCLALTRFPRQVSGLYAADLLGAAAGCILLVFTLDFTDGPTAVIVVACLASASSVFFALDQRPPRLLAIASLLTLLLGFFAVAHTALVQKQIPLLRLLWVKGNLEPRPLYEKWNSFSRIRVWGDPADASAPFGWSLSNTYPAERTVRQLFLDIDALAGTVLTAFNGDLNEIEHLKYDVTNLVHYLRPGSRVFVIGTGGGRDILSALAFEQKSVMGVEINKEIIRAVNGRFGDFTGHLDRDPRVTFVNDEARSYITRVADRFDIIQSSLIDTFAATAAGAFVLTENSLYTVDAWNTFLEHLTPRGVLTFSWWYLGDKPSEIYRLTSLATASLSRLGITDPRRHIVVVRHMNNPIRGVGTLLVGREPFSAQDLDLLEATTRQLRFEIVLSPRFSSDSTFATIAHGKDLKTFAAKFPTNITPPVDDSPFFFNMLRLRDAFNRDLWGQAVHKFHMRAVFVLCALLATVVGLTALFIIVPLILTTKKNTLEGALPFFVFFAAIGFGFMLVEISQMQRLIIFLGHPTYGLSVVLLALLLSSGLGSYFTRGLNTARSAILALAILLGVLIVFGMLTPYYIDVFRGSATTSRIAVATGILFLPGLFMGMAFPLGLKAAALRSSSITPWLWGINGATSVCASVLAVVIALGSSISASFWAGFSSYAVAFAALIWATATKDRSATGRT